VFGALRAGARGYLTKDASSEDIRTAILTVAAGDVALDPAVQHHVVDALANDRNAHQPGGASDAANLPDDLTPREAEVLALIAEGLTKRGDRRPPRRQPDNGQIPHQPPLHQGQPPRPRASSQLRLPHRDRHTTPLRSTLSQNLSSARAPPGRARQVGFGGGEHAAFSGLVVCTCSDAGGRLVRPPNTGADDSGPRRAGAAA
jgi:hypothetical protein